MSVAPPPIQDPGRQSRRIGWIVALVVFGTIIAFCASMPTLLERALVAATTDSYDPPDTTRVRDIPLDRLRQLEEVEKKAKLTIPRDAFFLKMEADSALDSSVQYWIVSPAKLPTKGFEKLTKGDYMFSSELDVARRKWPSTLPSPNEIYTKDWDAGYVHFDATIVRTAKSDYLYLMAFTG